MPFFLDNKPIAVNSLGEDASIGQLLEWVKSRMAGTGRLVLGLRCNDEDLDAEQIGDMLSAPIADFERLDFFSGQPEEAVLDALKASRRAFEDTFPTVKHATDALAAGDLLTAMNLLGDCFGIWGQTHQAVLTSGRLLEIDFQTLQVAGRQIVVWVNELADKLREVKAAIESRDHVLLGDILRYELDETLQHWEQMLGGFIDLVESRSTNAEFCVASATR